MEICSYEFGWFPFLRVLGSIPIKKHQSPEILPMGALQRPLISPTVSVKNEIIVSMFPLTGAPAKRSSYFSSKVLGFSIKGAAGLEFIQKTCWHHFTAGFDAAQACPLTMAAWRIASAKTMETLLIQVSYHLKWKVQDQGQRDHSLYGQEFRLVGAQRLLFSIVSQALSAKLAKSI